MRAPRLSSTGLPRRASRFSSPRALLGLAATPALAASVLAASVAVAAGAGARAGAVSPPRCATSGLVVWLDDEAGGGAAGSSYYKLEFTNLSRRTCTLLGYPGVSAVDLSGRGIGRAAARESVAAPRTVTLRAGAGAAAVLRIVDAGNFPSSRCGQVTAAGLRVYPPGQRVSRLVPFPFAACSRTAVQILSVRAVGRS